MSLKPQEYYDLLCQSAVDGTFPSVGKTSTGNSMCLYRGENGKRCAIGVALPDEKYQEHFDDPGRGGTSIWALVAELYLSPEDVCEEATLQQLDVIQRAHDVVVNKKLDFWSPREFVREINHVSLFQDCTKKDPEEFPEKLEEESCLTS